MLYAQRFLTDMLDTSTKQGKGLYPVYNQFDHLRISGYMQPQLQFSEERGIKSFEGGDFEKEANNRFMLRRGRIRFDYTHFTTKNKPLALFAFQFDGTERGVNIRDFWGRLYESKWELFSITAGMFARPFGYEVNVSSSDRESPERGRMSQILMKTERDLGLMLTLDARNKYFPLQWLKIDLGLFNGQGLAGTRDYDSHKDIIGRIAMKSTKINRSAWKLSAATSFYYGGITNQNNTWAIMKGEGAQAVFYIDSSASLNGRNSPRRYFGADAQLKIPTAIGQTELRAEWISGVQTGTLASSESPGIYPTNSSGIALNLYQRNFNGAYFYFIQNLFKDKWQLLAKYDWYDPNTKVAGLEINPIKGFGKTDIKYSTLGVGVLHHINTQVKATFYYAMVNNESTAVPGYHSDLADDVFTFRLQFKF